MHRLGFGGFYGCGFRVVSTIAAQTADSVFWFFLCQASQCVIALASTSIKRGGVNHRIKRVCWSRTWHHRGRSRPFSAVACFLGAVSGWDNTQVSSGPFQSYIGLPRVGTPITALCWLLE